MDSSGNTLITWMQEDAGATYHVFKSEYRNSIWDYPANLDDHISLSGQVAEAPCPAMDDNGNAIVVWQQSDGSNLQIFKSEYRNSTWSHPSGLNDNISPDGQGAEQSQAAMDNSGNCIIAWSQDDGTNSQMFKSEFRNDTWTHPADLTDNFSPDGTHASEYPDIAMNSLGEAVIVWAQPDGSNYQIFLSEYRQP
jgi:hypothetical protein